MPKVTIDAARGLVQTAGSGVEINAPLTLNSTFSAASGITSTGAMIATGSMTVTGSLNVTGSMTMTGSLNNLGNLNIAGAVTTSGNVNLSGTGILKGQKENALTLNTDDTLLASSSNDVLFLVQTNADRSGTLPAPAAGLAYKFILKTAAANAWNILVADGAHDFVGSVLWGTSSDANGVVSDTAVDGDTMIRFVGGTALAGDWVTLHSDGTDWFVSGASTRAGGIIFA